MKTEYKKNKLPGNKAPQKNMVGVTSYDNGNKRTAR